MHGSVNWLFRTRDYYPGADLLGKPRKLYQLTDRYLGVNRLQYKKGRGRPWMMFPLIVPPVYEKHTLIRSNLSEVWSNAEAVLRVADKVVFWGYSFPAADTHARHFFRTLSERNPALKSPYLLNPDPGAAAALWSVLRPQRLSHFRDARAYLRA